LKERTVIAIMGLPLSGKTTLGKKLSEKLGLHFIDIDDGPANCAPPRNSSPYSSEEKRNYERNRMVICYRVLHEAVAANLSAGNSFLISATYARQRSQKFLINAVRKSGGNLKLVWCHFDDQAREISKRIEDRKDRGKIGGCRSLSHYLDDKERFEGTNLSHIQVRLDSLEDLEESIAKISDYINE